MYLFDTNIFYALSHFYPDNFHSLWIKINSLVSSGELISVKEVYREIKKNCPEEHIELWVKSNKEIFIIPTEKELKLVANMMTIEENRNLIKKNNILKGLPVADPFILAVAKIRNAIVVTQEADKSGARIPNICKKNEIECISLQKFFNKENVKY
jgi:predicted nucleic acid-binding protein